MTEKPGSSDPLDRIGVRPVGGRAGQITLLSPREISYAFLGAAAPLELQRFFAESHERIEPGRVYVRAARGVFRTSYRRLAELRRALEPGASEAGAPRFLFAISRTCLVNVLKIAAIVTGGRTPLLVFAAADGRKEMLTVTRRAWPALRDRLRLPRRHGGASNPARGGGRAAGGTSTPARRSGDGQSGGSRAE
jgi:hypothetical protein